MPDPERFGVAVFDEAGEFVDIEEKPESPSSSVAIGGIYLYDEDFWTHMDEEMAAKGNDFSISDLNKRYVELGKAALRDIYEYVWLDCGTPDALLAASELAAKGILSPEPCNLRAGDPDPNL